MGEQEFFDWAKRVLAWFPHASPIAQVAIALGLLGLISIAYFTLRRMELEPGLELAFGPFKVVLVGLRKAGHKISESVHPQPIAQKYRTALANKVWNYWIENVFLKSFHTKVRIQLSLEEYPEAVSRPWNIVHTALEQQQTVAALSHSKLLELFGTSQPGRTLLILGDPGAGKTTTLLALGGA